MTQIFRKILCGLLAAFFCIQANAQQVLYSPYSNFSVKEGNIAVVGKTGGRIYTFRGDSDGYFLDAWNDSMQPVATVILDFLPQKIYDTQFSIAGDSITLLYQYQQGRDLFLYGAVLDGEGRLLRRPLKLDQKRTGFLGAGNEYYSFLSSDDKRSLAAFTIGDDSRELEVKAVVFQNDLNSIRRIGSMVKRDGNLLAVRPVLTNNRDLVIPVRQTTGRRDAYDKLFLLRFADSARAYSVMDIPTTDVFVEEPFIRTAPQDGNIYVAAFYSNRKNGNPDGLLYAGFDGQTFNSIRQISVPFNDQLRAMTGERSLRHAFANQHLRQLIIRNDGGFVAISEESYVNTRSNYSPGWGYYSVYGPFMGGTQVREYFYNDILALSVDASGALQWPSFIRKEQYSQEDGGLFSSFAFVNTGANLGFLYNNFNRQRSSITLVQMEADGQQQFRNFDVEGETAPDWLPRMAKQVSAREVIVPCLMRKKICFARVAF